MSTYRCVGVMSGTSLDGIDICCAEFTGDVSLDVWSHRLLTGVTYPYTDAWSERLRTAPTLCGEDLIRLHIDYGHLVGRSIRRFIDESRLDGFNVVASHGHTVFHQPHRQLTFQLGDGETIASYVRCPVVNNFRAKDVALGGQGAPLVSLGEAYLFSGYDILLNLGGIANVSVVGRDASSASGCVAFDVCPCNMLLNYLSQRLPTGVGGAGVNFDEGGAVSATGNIIEGVLHRLDELSYYTRLPPKSLGREWIEEHVLPIVDVKLYPVRDLLRTAVEHISRQLARAISMQCSTMGKGSDGSVSRRLRLLVTGGGFHNSFLMSRLEDALTEAVSQGVVIERDCGEDTVDFKEAVVFAFLGLRCLLGLVNVDSAVTGAAMDTVSGAVHLGVNRTASYVFHEDMRANLRKSSNAVAQRDSSLLLPSPVQPRRVQSMSAADACAQRRAQLNTGTIEQIALSHPRN